METQFFPTSAPGWIDGRPNTPVRFEDLNTNNILLVLVKTWIDPDTNANTEVFQLEMVEGGGSNVELKRTTYLFKTFGLTIAGFKALLDIEASSNNVVSYADLFAIDHVDKTIVTRDVLVNDDKVVRRVYNVAGDYTTLYLNAGNEITYKKIYVVGNQESGFDFYYDVY